MYPKRYHVLDFNKCMLYVKKNKDTSNDDKSVKAIGFRDIYKVSLPDEKEE